MEEYFKDCKTDSDVMRVVMRLATRKDLQRSDINKAAAKRKEELLEEKKSKVYFPKRIVLPTAPVFEAAGFNGKQHIISSNFSKSNTFEFLGNGNYKF